MLNSSGLKSIPKWFGVGILLFLSLTPSIILAIEKPPSSSKVVLAANTDTAWCCVFSLYQCLGGGVCYSLNPPQDVEPPLSGRIGMLSWERNAAEVLASVLDPPPKA